MTQSNKKNKNMLRNKYKKHNIELIDELLKKNHSTIVLSINLIGTSKVKDNFIYECVYLDQSSVKNISIIAQDVTQALARLEPYVNLGIPEQTLRVMLGSERLSF